MMLAWPWALFGLVSLPLLVALYFLRRRSRPLTVPSLLLWRHLDSEKAAGRRRERLQRSRFLPLEILILLLLMLAAAGPWWMRDTDRRPLYVVLDDSFSMLAGGDGSARRLGVDALQDLLAEGRHEPVHWILAGHRARRLDGGEDGDNTSVPAQWRGSDARSSLQEAIALAVDLGEPKDHILVVTDHPPARPPEDPRVRWWALGEPRDNVALVGLSRRPAGEVDHLLVEVSHFGSRPIETTLDLTMLPPETLADGALGSVSSERMNLRLGPGEAQRHRLEVSPRMAVDLVLAADDLEIDNRGISLPNRRRPVTVALDLADGELRQLMEKTLVATGDGATRVDGAADLTLTERRLPLQRADVDSPWIVSLTAPEGKARPFVGPFIVDTEDPLTEGLALEGVIWSADEGLTVDALPTFAKPLISAGEVPLWIDYGTVDDRRQLSLRWHGKASNLQRTPNWPILWWNLLDGCRAQRPGVHPVNGRLGSPMTWRLAPGEESEAAVLRLPNGEERRLQPGVTEVDGLEAGLHRLRVGERDERFVVNPLAAAESDLRRADTQRSGEWTWQDAVGSRRQEVWPWLLLVVFALSFLHLHWTRASRGPL